MTARAPHAPSVEDDPVLRAFARAPLSDDALTPEQLQEIQDAEREARANGKVHTHEEVIAAACAHFGVTRSQWDAGGGDSSR
jgi:hypothetical protein